MNLVCVINSMGGGGAERVMSILSEGLARRGHSVTVLTLDPSIPDFYPVPPGVERSKAEGPSGDCRWYQFARQRERVRALRASVLARGPDLVISFVDVTNVLTLAALKSSAIPVAVCEHINPLQYRLPPHWELLRRLLYPSAAAVVMLTADTLPWARSMARGTRVAAIPDPVPAPVFSPESQRPEFFGKGRNILGMGRLIEQKGFDILLRAFAKLSQGFQDWNLTILGEGPRRGALEDLRDRLGLAGRASLPGASRAPYDVLRHTDLFVLSSRFEGFGMALAEAMTCGVACVSFDCPSGPGLMVRNGVDGLLVPPKDEAALARAMVLLMSDDRRREELAARAPEVERRFGIEKYLDEWEALMAELAGSAARSRAS